MAATFLKKRFGIIALSAVVLLLASVQGFRYGTHLHPQPAGGGENEEMEERKKAYLEHIHRAAPGTNWREIEAQNQRDYYFNMMGFTAARTTTSYAGGVVNGTWYERGNDNLAGRMDYFAFQQSSNTLYGLSDGGSIWKTSLPTVAWTKVSDVAEFTPYAMGVIDRTGGGARLFAANTLQVWYTDNNGASFDTSTGISFPVAWGGNYINRIFPVNDAAHTIYCVTFGWEPSSWTAEYGLYSSTDSGVSFHFLRYFPYHNDNQLSFSSPVGSGTLYALGVTSSSSDTLYTISGSSVSTAGVSTSIASGDNYVDMKCMVTGGVTHFYALTGGNHVYHSTNMGATWTLQSTLSNPAYIIGVSSQHPNDVMYGGVEAYRSNDSGATWTLVNAWGSYYGAMATDLHADLRNFSFFQYSSGTEFGMVGTDGGAFITNDQLNTVSNISLNGLHVNQLWDHITDPADTNIVVGGAQDQGLQSTNAAGGFGIINENQVISGDYGQLRITGGGNTLWPEYPGGNLYLYNYLSAPAYIGTWTMTGTQLPNYGWMLPTANYFTSGTTDDILIGGGNITGDSGSYLIHLSLDMSGGFAVNPTQYSYNFRPNTNTGTAGISSIAVSPLSTSLMYVGAEDGTFFYSSDAGTTWTKTPSFAGTAGDWLYGSAILPSVDSVNKVYFGGSGYSNPAVYVSRDHGTTFDSMSNGLPHTLVNAMASYSNDSFLFAATDAGPYVYVKANNRWYSLGGPGVPYVSWRSVEYLPSKHTVRFGTYGRGIWDFVMPTSHVNSVTTISSPASNITVGPNPVKSGTPLRLFSAAQQTVHLNVYTSAGKLVLAEDVATNTQINMPDVSTGIYMYEIIAGGRPQSGLLVIN